MTAHRNLPLLAALVPSALILAAGFWSFSHERGQTMLAVRQLSNRADALESQGKQHAESLTEIRTDIRWIRQTLEQSRTIRP